MQLQNIRIRCQVRSFVSIGLTFLYSKSILPPPRRYPSNLINTASFPQVKEISHPRVGGWLASWVTNPIRLIQQRDNYLCRKVNNLHATHVLVQPLSVSADKACVIAWQLQPSGGAHADQWRQRKFRSLYRVARKHTFNYSMTSSPSHDLPR